MRYGSLLASIYPSGRFNVCGANVPRGVRTSAEGDGLFKKTEIARQTQMQPAEEGLSVGEE
jgi:hypothetical protein